MNNISLERKIEVYEAVLRKMNVHANLVVDHTKTRELMVAIMNWQYACRDGEYTEEEQQEKINRAFELLANLVGV
jgi:hypothetical protein